MTSRTRERGGVTLLLVLVLLVFAALLGALAVRGATGDLQMAGSQRAARTNLYCAEAGLNAARPIFAAAYGEWNNIFTTGTAIGFNYPVTGDLDGDGIADYSVTIKDNVDEVVNNPNADSDLAAIMISTCTSSKYASDNNTSRTLEQLVVYTGLLGSDYRFQAGHSSTHSGNENQ